MNVFDLNAKIGLDSSAFDKGLSGAESAIKSFGGVLGGIGKAAGTAVLGGLGALGTAATKITKDAVDSYGEYEQLVGGVKTLFDTSADQILEYSKKAYATAGLSTNDYLQTVTSFAASLVQSAGRGAQQDTEALEAELDAQYNATKRTLEDEYDEVKKSWDKRVKEAETGAAREALSEQRDDALKALKRANEDKLAELKAYNKQLVAEAETANMTSVTTPESLERAAKLADMAIQDMSDNANKMGTNMQSIQNAYQGFAKQNFMMLDNLKLGYGGTKTEMERLLRDATAISGVEYDVKSYADIVEAIHVIQQNLKITGTTADEASGTIQGSAKAVKAAWQNLVTGIADDNADVGQLIDDFFNSLVAAADNMLPRIAKSINGVVKFFNKSIVKLPQVLKKYMPMVTDSIKSLIPALVLLLPQVFDVAEEIINTLVQGILDNAPAIITSATKLISSFAKGIFDAIPMLLNTAVNLITDFGLYLTQNVDKLLSSITIFVKSLAEMIVKNLPILFQTANILVVTLANGISQNLPEIISAVISVVLAIVQELTNPDSVAQIIGAAITIISALVDGIITALPQILEAAPQIVLNIVRGINDTLDTLHEATGMIIGKIVEFIFEPETLTRLVSAAVGIMLALAEGIIENIVIVTASVLKIITAMVEEFKKPENINRIANSGADILKVIVGGIARDSKTVEEIGNFIIGNFIKGIRERWTNFYNYVVERGGLIQIIKDWIGKAAEWGRNVINNLISGIKGKWEDLKTWYSNVGGIKGIFQSAIDGALNWGRDLVDNFLGGIKRGWENLKGGVKNVAQGIKDFLGFSEPKLGPLSDFHTYAPDMMKLFAQGIKDNEHLITDQIGSSFDFQNGMGARQGAQMSYGGGRQAESRNLTIILEVDKQKFARAVVDLSKLETQRQGRILFSV